MSAAQEMARRELARRKLLPFVQYTKPDYEPGWVHKKVCTLLDSVIDDVIRKASPRLMVFLPPGAGKSEIISRRFPPYILGRYPDLEVVSTTYSQDFANDFGRDVRSVMRDPVYQNVFPNRNAARDSNAVDHFRLQGFKGKYTTVGVGGPLTGRRAHLIIIDDPVKNREEADSPVDRETKFKWFLSVARTRLYPGGGIIVVQTRWHEDDLAGKILRASTENPHADQYVVYSFPAIAEEDEPERKKGEALHPERYDLKELITLRETYKASNNMREWSALYQQSPVPDDGDVFRREWVKYGTPPSGCTWYIGTDFAISQRTTADYTVLLPAAVDTDSNVYLAEPVRGRFTTEEIIAHIVALVEKHRPRSLILEMVHISKTLGPLLKQRLWEKRLFVHIEEVTPVGDKRSRAASLQGMMQAGRVFFPDTSFGRDYMTYEFLAFDAGRNDDIVDAAALIGMVVNRLRAPRPPSDAPKEEELPDDCYEKLVGSARSAGRTFLLGADGKFIPAGDAHVPGGKGLAPPRHLNGKVRKPSKRGNFLPGRRRR